MKKIILALFLLISLGEANSYFENESGHTDNIYAIYNNSCIETVNYLYLFFTSPEKEILKEDVDIWLENITQIGPKAFKADIYYID